jgi:hypothetical protein
VDVLERALKLSLEIKADWAGCHFSKEFELV